MFGERFKDWTELEICKWSPYIVNTMEEKNKWREAFQKLVCLKAGSIAFIILDLDLTVSLRIICFPQK